MLRVDRLCRGEVVWMGRDTRPNVFIVESNSLKDERRQYNEGEILSQVLRMMGKETEYRYIRTSKELGVMAQEFRKSRFRYLHMACHGAHDRFGLTLDEVPFADYARIVGPAIENRRLFLSACSIAQPGLARAVFHRYGPYSITGPSEDVHFADAAVVWASLYRLLFKYDTEIIEGGVVRRYLQKLCELHDVKFVHFGRTKKQPRFREYHLSARSS
jgi:hypothetical protein